MRAVEYCFHIVDEDDRKIVRLSVDGEEKGCYPFECELDEDSELVQAIELIEDNKAKRDDFRYVGELLWDGLINDEVQGLLNDTQRKLNQEESEICHIRISSGTDALERLPWESLYSGMMKGFLADESKYCIVREVSNLIQVPVIPKRNDGPLRILFIVPTDSELQYGRELNAIKRAAISAGDPDLDSDDDGSDSIDVELFDSEVTPDALEDKLNQGDWDIAHFVGHGELRDKTVFLRMNGDESPESVHWIDAETFASLFKNKNVRLVFLNCCEGTAKRPSPNLTLSGAAPFLIRNGVPSVIAMRYAIDDDVAVRFSKDFYKELLNGKTPGFIDRATQVARGRVFKNRRDHSLRGFITPNLYFIERHEKLGDFGEGDQRTSESSGPKVAGLTSESGTGSVDESVPEFMKTAGFRATVEAFRKDRCIPIVGAEIRSGNKRRGVAVGDKMSLTRKLAASSGYPSTEDFDLCQIAGSWMDSLVMHWVCQHFQSKGDRSYLIDAIVEFYEKARPNRVLLQLARLNFPGIFYLPIDGLMEVALNTKRSDFRVVNLLDNDLSGSKNERLLINVNGSIDAPKRLILTVADVEKLYDRMWQLDSHVTNLVAGHSGQYGRRVCFIGVSPRDPLVRRLAKKLFDEVRKGDDFDSFSKPVFVCEDHSLVDQSYWDRYDTLWVPAEAGEFVSAVVNALDEEEGRE